MKGMVIIMNLKAKIQKRLSALSFIVAYLLMVVAHLFIDSFIPSLQISLLTTMLPFIILGFIIDFLINRNDKIKHSYALAAKILPIGIFLVIIISTALEMIDRKPLELFNYFIWLFVSVPFMIASYNKDEHRKRVLYAGIGLAFIVIIYLYLTTQTKQLNTGYGSVIYFFSIFMMLYAASSIRKLPFISSIIGVLFAIALLWIKFLPSSTKANVYGWDYDIYFQFELILVVTFILCIIVRLVAEFLGTGTFHSESIKKEPKSSLMNMIK